MNEKNAGKKYRPSNGTEGDCFFAVWCHKCTHFEEENGISCEIVGLTFLHDVEDPEYPVEWQYRKDGQPMCAAFRPEGGQEQLERCKHTVDMFNGGVA